MQNIKEMSWYDEIWFEFLFGLGIILWYNFGAVFLLMICGMFFIGCIQCRSWRKVIQSCFISYSSIILSVMLFVSRFCWCIRIISSPGAGWPCSCWWGLTEREIGQSHVGERPDRDRPCLNRIIPPLGWRRVLTWATLNTLSHNLRCQATRADECMALGDRES